VKLVYQIKSGDRLTKILPGMGNPPQQVSVSLTDLVAGILSDSRHVATVTVQLTNGDEITYARNEAGDNATERLRNR